MCDSRFLNGPPFPAYPPPQTPPPKKRKWSRWIEPKPKITKTSKVTCGRRSNGVADGRFQRHRGCNIALLLQVPVRADVAALRLVAVGLLGQVRQLAFKGFGFLVQEPVPDLAQSIASGPPLYDLRPLGLRLQTKFVSAVRLARSLERQLKQSLE